MGLKCYLKALLPSLLVAIFPILFFYNHNATKIHLQSLLLPLLIMVFIALFITGITVVFIKSSIQDATVASIIFLIFFYIYGFIYNRLLIFDKFQIEHVTFLPIYIFISFLFIKIGLKLSRLIQINLLLGVEIIFGILIIYNIVGIVPIELRKHNTEQENQAINSPNLAITTNAVYPDIYYIVLDESVGFNALRTYWKFQEIDDFISFLESKGFFVAEGSRSKTHETMEEIASRLNLVDMTGVKGYSAQDWFDAISNNEVMQTLKQYGYTTIVLDQVRAANAYVTKTPMNADYNFDADKIYSRLWAFDDFFSLVFTRTMLRPFCDKLRQSDPFIIQHRNDVLFFFDKIADLDDIESPKFVYGQVLLTHVPLIFDEDGGMLDQKNYYNWDYYIDSYKFEIIKMTELINTLLAQADPQNPPIIILQSDHGFRNINSGHAGGKILPDYPEEYKYEIVNALLLPGYDTSQLPDDLNPINTFIIILNHYFNKNIPMQ